MTYRMSIAVHVDQPLDLHAKDLVDLFRPSASESERVRFEGRLEDVVDDTFPPVTALTLPGIVEVESECPV